MGAQLGLSHERIRQLEQEALAWLRHPAHSLPLRQLLGKNTAYLLHTFRRERNLSRHEVLRILRSKEGSELRQRLGFEEDFPSESGLRYFENQITSELQWEINALQMDLLYQAGLLPTRPDEEKKVTLSFDGLLHEARSRMRCAKACLGDPERTVPDCDYLDEKYKHGYTTTVGRTHADATVRLAREIPYGSPAWEEQYNRRNSSESRNSVQERLGLKRLPVHGLPRAYSEVLLADFVANQRTLVRLVREATLLPLAQVP